MYIPGNEFEIIGAKQGQKTMRELISAQMDDVYFPVTIKEMGARLYFRDLEPGDHTIDGIEVKAMFLSHPGMAISPSYHWAAVSVSIESAIRSRDWSE